VVVTTGAGVKRFSSGDNVAVIRAESTLSDARFGAFQQYALACADSTSKLLPATTLVAGAATILNLATVASALTVFLGLDRPALTSSAGRNGKKVLIYGGSSSSGGLAIRYATAAGYEVVTTSSPKNYDFVVSLGPVIVIDHTQPANKVVGDLWEHGPYHKILDTIGLPPVTNIMTEYLSSIGGGSYNSLVPLLGGENPVPDNVERKFESYGWVYDQPQHKELREWFYNKLVPQGLATETIIPTRAQWVKGGLEKTQSALDLMDRGEVSGHKLVMDPWE
jgi:NADPH:quinone reductase-like Zn-dependent oxidoreductase